MELRVRRGGPGRLAAAITALFARVDGLEPEAMPERWVDQQVCDPAQHDHLRIPVADLRAHYDPDPLADDPR